ncbi:MAG: FecR domain-containing protein [Bdellovibrionales bacterium]|nr:FecR domain-containing protein [Bdellovibrionales bacterium]
MKMLLGISTVLSLVSVAAWAEPMYGVLMVVKGSVKVQNASKQTTDAKVGSKVAEGDTVITAADSRAKIVMSDRNVINVNPDTQVQIAKYENDAASGKKNVEMNLLQGKVRNNVEQTYDGEKNKFLIKTPTAVAGVRGTQFLAGFDPKTKMTSIVTFKGAVTLASIGANGAMIGTPVVIKKGEMTQSAPDKTPEAPKAVPKEDMKKMDGESTASNKESKKDGDQKREVASESSSSSKETAKEGVPAGLPPAPAPMVDAKDMDAGAISKDIKVQTSVVGTPPPTAPTPPKTAPTATPIQVRSGNTLLKVVPKLPPSN